MFRLSNVFSLSILVLMSLLSGCRKASTVTLNEAVQPDGVVKFEGTFVSKGGQDVSGKCIIYSINKSYQLKLENFSTSNGPDLKVYLSKADKPVEFISLGDLKSTNGNQVYDISGTPDFSIYKYVLIHCQKYNHLYGAAELK